VCLLTNVLSLSLSLYIYKHIYVYVYIYKFYSMYLFSILIIKPWFFIQLYLSFQYNHGLESLLIQNCTCVLPSHQSIPRTGFSWACHKVPHPFTLRTTSVPWSIPVTITTYHSDSPHPRLTDLDLKWAHLSLTFKLWLVIYFINLTKNIFCIIIKYIRFIHS
jgi:hypothetical protein